MASCPTVVAELRKNSRERLRVALDNFQGHDLIDIRVTTQVSESSDVWAPTRKGVSLAIAKLPELIAALQAAEAKAREMGVL